MEITTQYFTGFFAIVTTEEGISRQPERRKASPVRLNRIGGEDDFTKSDFYGGVWFITLGNGLYLTVFHVRFRVVIDMILIFLGHT